jgi:hypothetical protein
MGMAIPSDETGAGGEGRQRSLRRARDCPRRAGARHESGLKEFSNLVKQRVSERSTGC